MHVREQLWINKRYWSLTTIRRSYFPCQNCWRDSVYAYTIVQNLFVNAVKYSMEHTRIFVKTYVDNGQIVLEVINVSAEPIDVEADKLKERLVRGDASRSTEGNGLGLRGSYIKSV